MIAKKAPRRKDSKSSYGDLVSYILREFKEVEYSRVTNCGFDDPALAVKEIEATQARNKRSKADKTYHLVIAFPPGERPTKAQLEDIEDEMCRAIGFGDHQRISMLHTDTDNVHLHVAINKIHPVSHNNVALLRDYYRIDEACSILEERHGLIRTNRIDRTNSRDKERDLQPGRPGDMEAHSGRNSFKRWLTGTPKDDLAECLKSANSWDDLHRALARYDVIIRPRGAGLVVSARNAKAFTKASDLGREFSKGVLEKRFGEYQKPSEAVQAVEPEQRYRKAPLHNGAERSALWEEYQRERHTTAAEKRRLLSELKQARAEEVQRQRRENSARREEIRKDTLLTRGQKRDVYRQVSKNRKVQSAAALQNHRAAVRQLHDQYRLRSWQDYLIDKATDGNTDALALLRARARKPTKGAERFAFTGDDQAQVFTPLKPDVQANGDVLYIVSGARIRDTGQRLRLDVDQGDGIVAGLRLAREKYGSHLDIEGDERFKAAIVEAAVGNGMAVTFADPAMEQRRRVLQEMVDAKKEHDQEQGKTRSVIQAWIAKRNETRARATDILEHREFRESDSGTAIYRGSRKIGEEIKVGLYEKSGVMLVAPITERQSARFRRQRIGSTVTINKRGHVQFQRERGHGR